VWVSVLRDQARQVSWQFAGYGAPIDGFCEMPAKMVDPSDPEGWYWSRCGCARPSRCAPCAEIKRQDVAAVGRSGWTDRVIARGWWVTLTAPGSDLLPWDTSRCRHGSAVECSGKIGCRVDDHALAIWHDELPQRWSWFMTELRRELGVDVQFFKTWEPQNRGALHAHSMMRSEPVSERRFRAAVKAAARRWGFGEQVKVEMVDLSDSEQAAKCAGYCAKYSSKGADALPAVERLSRATGEIRHGGIRSWSSSRSWGDTMAAVKLRRCVWAATNAATVSGAAATLPGDGEAGALDSYQGIYAGVTPELVDQWIDSLL
jgi:hypothetical protein